MAGGGDAGECRPQFADVLAHAEYRAAALASKANGENPPIDAPGTCMP